MKRNVGKTDAYIRYALGIVFIVLAIVWQWWFIIVAVIAFGTGFFRTCPLYMPFRIKTNKNQKQ